MNFQHRQSQKKKLAQMSASFDDLERQVYASDEDNGQSVSEQLLRVQVGTVISPHKLYTSSDGISKYLPMDVISVYRKQMVLAYVRTYIVSHCSRLRMSMICTLGKL